MNTTKRVLHVLLPVLILTVASLACGPITPPTSTPEPTNTPEPTKTPIPTETPVPTPTSTPTPTSIPLPEMDAYTNEQIGLSMDYPADWYMEEDEGDSTTSVIFSTEEDFDPGQVDGAGFGLIAVDLEGAITDVEELWDLFAGEASDEDTQIGDPEPSTVGGQDAVGGSYASTADDAYGRLTMVIANDYGYVFLAVVSPVDDWEDYEPTFNALLDSVEFSEPSLGGDGGGGGDLAARDDVPIPADAEVSLDMQTMVSYLTGATVPGAVQFVEDNWPDYGWVADTSNILHQPSEGLLFFTKGKETAMIAVSEDDEDSTKTSVVVLIIEEE